MAKTRPSSEQSDSASDPALDELRRDVERLKEDNAPVEHTQDLGIARELLTLSPNSYERASQLINKHFVALDGPSLAPQSRLLLLVSMMSSVRPIPGYATLAAQHITEINQAIENIASYIRDPSRKRPLNILMLASPGSGKSHLVKCMTRSAQLKDERIGTVEFNMATLGSGEDLAGALDEARNVKIDDRVPLLFLDEFDSSDSNYSLLLPLLWDGAFTMGNRSLKLGKIVIVLAGSSPDLPKRVEQTKRMLLDSEDRAATNSKSTDLFSRINGGVLFIPSLDNLQSGLDRRVDKVVIAAHLLRRRLGDSLRLVPRGLLQFIANIQLRYDVRSIAHLVDMIPFAKDRRSIELDDLVDMPAKCRDMLRKSSLAYHLIHRDGPIGIEELWKATVLSAHGAETVPIHSTRVFEAFGAQTDNDRNKFLYDVFNDIKTL